MAIICHCLGMRERAIVKAIHHGASTLDEVGAACGAATRCGGCAPMVEALLDRHTQLAPDYEYAGICSAYAR